MLPWVFVFLTLVPPVVSGVYISAMPSVMGEFSENASSAQLALTASLAGMAAGQFIVGPLADKVGRRRPLLISTGISAVASVACALSPDIGTLTAMRFAQGLSAAMGMVLASVIATDVFRGRTLLRMFSVMAMIGTLGPIAAPIVGSWWLGFGDWRGMFLICATLSALTFIASILLVPETLASHARVNGGLRSFSAALRSVLRRPRFLGYGASRGLAYAVVVAFTASSPFLLRGALGFGERGYLTVYFAGVIGLALTALIAPQIVDRFGADTTLFVGFAFAAIGSCTVVLAAIVPAPAVVTVFGLLLAVWSLGLIIGTSSGLAMEQVRDYAGTGSSLVGGAMFGIGALISMLVAVGDPTETWPTGVLVLTCSIAGLAVTARLRTQG